MSSSPWPTGQPDSCGLDPNLLESLPARFPHINSLLVARHGRLVFERYFNGWGPDDTQPLASAAKSFLSTLAGIALQQGLLDTLDRPLVSFYTGMRPHDMDPRFPAITLRHLLSMSSGLDYGGPPPAVDAWLSAPDWLDRALRLKVIHEPGTTFAYKPDPRLLSWALRQAAGEPLSTFAAQHLFAPLGAGSWEWPLDQGRDGIALSPRDALKLPQLFLNGGQWQGQTLLHPAYARAAIQPHSPGGFPERLAYGYYWWVDPPGAEEPRVFYASGFGGQYLAAFPALDLLVAVTAPPDRPRLVHQELVRQVAAAANS